jgi:hypothetical protein
VGESGPARAAAALTAPSVRGLRAGEVVTVRERRGVWTRLGAHGGAPGWVESQRLRELGRD